MHTHRQCVTSSHLISSGATTETTRELENRGFKKRYIKGPVHRKLSTTAAFVFVCLCLFFVSLFLVNYRRGGGSESGASSCGVTTQVSDHNRECRSSRKELEVWSWLARRLWSRLTHVGHEPSCWSNVRETRKKKMIS